MKRDSHFLCISKSTIIHEYRARHGREPIDGKISREKIELNIHAMPIVRLYILCRFGRFYFLVFVLAKIKNHQFIYKKK